MHGQNHIKFVRYCSEFAWFQASYADWTRSEPFRVITAVCSGNSLPTFRETCCDSERIIWCGSLFQGHTLHFPM